MSEPTETPSCTIKRLPDHKVVEAARIAIQHNPANRPNVARLGAILPSRTTIKPEHIAFLTTKYWGAHGANNLTVSFLDIEDATLQNRILSHMNAWSKTADVKFSLSNTDPLIRIATTPGDGYWSYLGTDVKMAPANEPTMNLDSFNMDTPESEFHRVVRHETGHTLGAPHEHMRAEIVAKIARRKAIQYFMATQGWTRSEVIQQVLTPLSDEDFLIQTPDAEEDSIMCYQLPGNIMKDGKPVVGGMDITADDYAYAALIYPVQVA
jgi:hypothetical protein